MVKWKIRACHTWANLCYFHKAGFWVQIEEETVSVARFCFINNKYICTYNCQPQHLQNTFKKHLHLEVTILLVTIRTPWTVRQCATWPLSVHQETRPTKEGLWYQNILTSKYKTLFTKCKMKLRPLAAGIVDWCRNLHLQPTELLTHYDLATQSWPEANKKQNEAVQSTEWKAILHKSWQSNTHNSSITKPFYNWLKTKTFW
jgi:hypothetical protein